jgi:hypothetical protein
MCYLACSQAIEFAAAQLSAVVTEDLLGFCSLSTATLEEILCSQSLVGTHPRLPCKQIWPLVCSLAWQTVLAYMVKRGLGKVHALPYILAFRCSFVPFCLYCLSPPWLTAGLRRKVCV